MRAKDLKTTVNSLALGMAIALIGAAFLRPVYEKEQAERRAIEAEWIAERIAEEKAYQAEVAAEIARWEEIEAAQKEEAAADLVIVYEVLDDEYIPNEVEEAARHWGEIYDIAPEFLEAIAYHESRFDPSATNGSCVGLMQVAPKWHQDRMERLGFTEEDLMTVDGSMGVAADYLKELFETYDDPYWVLMTYNGDSNAEAYMNLEHSPSEYALNVVDTAFYITQTHEEGGQCEWLEE